MSPSPDPVVDAAIERADSLFAFHSADLARETVLGGLLAAYRNAIRETQTCMRTFGVVEACGLCDSREKGSCCFEGVEAWYEPELLLINMLMGVTLPRRREGPGQCLFLGRRGCKLEARYAFCVNFLCPSLKRRLGPSKVSALLAVAGRELLLGLDTERFLNRWLKSRRPGNTPAGAFTDNEEESNHGPAQRHPF